MDSMSNPTPNPTFLSSVISLFRSRTPEPTFAPATLSASPPMSMPATEVFVTRNVTTTVDPSPSRDRKPSPLPFIPPADLRLFDEKHRRSKAPAFVYPATPRAPSYPGPRPGTPHSYPNTPRAPTPQRTTFVVPLPGYSANVPNGMRTPRGSYRDDSDTEGEASASSSSRSSMESDRITLGVPPGQTIVCNPDVPGVYTLAEPKTLARALFYFGFFFPAFWIVGIAILMMPLRPTPDWEEGKTSLEIEWACKVIRQTELRWARYCLIALLAELSIIIAIVIIAKYGFGV